MSQRKFIMDFLGIQGWEVMPEDIVIRAQEVIVAIKRQNKRRYQCGCCGSRRVVLYDHLRQRLIRDFPVWGRKCFLKVRRARVKCQNCGVCVEKLNWTDDRQRQTLRYEKYLARLCEILSVKDIVRLEQVDKGTLYRLDKKWLTIRYERRRIRPVRYLGIDEIAVKKGLHYATIFYDLERREVIGMQKDRKETSASQLFKRLGKEFCNKIEAVCTDIWDPYLKSVRIHCPQAEVVFDKFHVYCFLSDAVDRKRRSEQQKATEEGYRVIKGSRWLWLKKPGTLQEHQKQTLREIMENNENLQKAYLLKEDFEQLYACTNKEEGLKCFTEWIERCRESNLYHFQRLARRLQRRLKGILAYFNHRITNAVAEGLNNKIKVLKRRCYGFHDEKYFFLKVMSITGALPSLEEVIHTN